MLCQMLDCWYLHTAMHPCHLANQHVNQLFGAEQ
jgi:hypothetical protein